MAQIFSTNILDHFWEPTNWLGALLYAIIFFIFAAFLSRMIRLAVSRLLLRHENNLVDPTIVVFLMQLAQISVYVVGLIIYFHIVPALNKLGTALLTGVSVMSVVFGLAAQNTLSNLVAGCTLLLYRPFHLDDLIQVATPTGTEMGIVERLTLGYTMLRTMDDRLVIVPNSLMASQVSLNLNRRSLYTMAMIQVGVLDNARVGDVRQNLSDLASQNKKIHRVMSVHAQTLDDSGTMVSLRAWCTSAINAKAVETEISIALEQHFAGQNLIITQPRPAPASSEKPSP